MKTRVNFHHALANLLLACAAFTMLLSACQPVDASTNLPPEQPTAVLSPTELPTALPTPVEVTQPPSESTGEIALDLADVAQDLMIESVTAAPSEDDSPWWAEYRRVTLQGYPVTEHVMKPQIYIYPVSETAEYSETAGQMLASLQALLASRNPVDRMPFLPHIKAVQVMHAQVRFMDFKNGQGVRFLTQYDQGPLPINNFELIYTYQGLTNDGAYYVAAVLPVTHADLPANRQVDETLIDEMNEFTTYLAETVDWLDQQAPAGFAPDLAKLDAMLQSLEVR